jgi:ATP-dependent helicase/nuclease subunit A
MFDLSRLTTEQRDALALDQHVFVEASAGSGKTAVLVARYLHILASCPDCDPSQILAVTYTRKAAAEMRHRIRQALETAQGDTLEDQIRIQQCLAKLPFATITTIHAFCKDMIADHSHAAGISPNIQVPSDEDREWAWQRALDSALNTMIANRDTRLHSLLAQQNLASIRDGLTQLYRRDEISRRFADRDYDDSHHSGDLQGLFQDIRALFQDEKQRMGWLDFPDMIAEMAALVERDTDVAAQIYDQYRFVMVDEFQDTDRVQWQLFQNLFLQEPHRNLFLVGDLKQAIYRFRGAEPHLFSEVRQWMRDNGGVVVELTQNFRSQQPLITFSNRLFKALFESSPTVDYAALHAVKQAEDRHVYIGLATTESKKKEAEKTESPAEIDLIISWILSMKTKHQAEWADIAVLCRKTSGLARIGHALQAAGIPIQQQQQNKTDVPVYYQDMTLLATLLVYPHDPIAWTGILRSPMIGMSDDDIVKLHQIRTQKKSLSAALASLKNEDSPSHTKAGHLLADIMTLRQHYPLGKSLSLLCHHYHWRHPQTLGYSVTHQEAESLIAQIALWDRHLLLSDPERLDRFQKWLIAGNMRPAESSATGVQIMTIHKSKGLEFPFVVVPECGKTFHASRGRKLIISDSGIVARMPGQEESFKNHMAAEETESMDEEKRIFYVACTRAKEELFLTGTVKLTEEFPEDFSPGSFWEFLAPYAKVEQHHVHLTLPISAPDDSLVLSCQRWTQTTKTDPLITTTDEKDFPVEEHQTSAPNNTVPDPITADNSPKWETLMGTIIHQLLATIWQQAETPNNDTLAALITTHLNTQFGDTAEDLLRTHSAPIAQHLQTTLQSPLAQAVFSAPQKYVEWPFSWVDTDKKNRDGRIDLLFQDADRWHIVDFKSSDTPEVTPDMLQTLIRYQKAAAHFLKIAPNDIQTSVFFTKTGEWVGL